MQHLFVYGSLLFPEIREGLTGKSFQTADAVLYGFKRHAVAGADYPAIVAHPSANVNGKIVFDVDKTAMQAIAFYEGDQYKTLRVKLLYENAELEVLVFVWNLEHDDLEEHDWNEHGFEQESLPFYLAEVVPETVEEFANIKAGWMNKDRMEGD